MHWGPTWRPSPHLSGGFVPSAVHQPCCSTTPQFAILVATFAALELFWYAAYGIGGHILARYLKRPSLKRVFNRVTGAIFVGFGVALLKARPA